MLPSNCGDWQMGVPCNMKSSAFGAAVAPVFLAIKHDPKHAHKPVSKHAKHDQHDHRAKNACDKHHKKNAQQKQQGPGNTERSKVLTTQCEQPTNGRDTQQAWPHLRPLLQPLALPVVAGCRNANLWQADIDAGTGRQFWWHVESRCWSWEPQQDFKKEEFEDINWQLVDDEARPSNVLDDHFEIEWSGSAIEFYSSRSGDNDE